MNWAQLGAILAVRRRNRGAGVKEVVKRRHSPRNRAPADALDAPTMLSTVEGREHSEVVLGRPPYSRYEEVVVHYYDIVDASNEELTEGDLRDALDDDEYYDCMERSSVREIKQWIQEGSITPSVALDDEDDDEDDNMDEQ